MDRLFGDDHGAARSRATMARQALQVIEANPFLGVGANNYAVWYAQYPKQDLEGQRLFTAHNKYLLVWAETGIVGLIAFLGYLLSVIRRGWRGWQFRDRLLSPLALGFAAAVLGQMAHMFFDIFHSRPQVQTLWIVAALVSAIQQIGMKRDQRA
jgi:O-antigen ligase